MNMELKEMEKGKWLCEYLLELCVQYEWCIKHKKVLGCDESAEYYKRFIYYIGTNYSIGKNLLLQERKGEKRIFLLIVPSFKQVDLKSISEELNAKKLEFVNSEKMEELLHTEPGNVSIFNLLYDKEKQVNLVLDDELLHSPLIAFHPLYNGMSIFLRPEEILKFLKLIGRRDTCMIQQIKEKGYQKVNH